MPEGRRLWRRRIRPRPIATDGRGSFDRDEPNVRPQPGQPTFDAAPATQQSIEPGRGASKERARLRRFGQIRPHVTDVRHHPDPRSRTTPTRPAGLDHPPTGRHGAAEERTEHRAHATSLRAPQRAKLACGRGGEVALTNEVRIMRGSAVQPATARCAASADTRRRRRRRHRPTRGRHRPKRIDPRHRAEGSWPSGRATVQPQPTSHR